MYMYLRVSHLTLPSYLFLAYAVALLNAGRCRVHIVVWESTPSKLSLFHFQSFPKNQTPPTKKKRHKLKNRRCVSDHFTVSKQFLLKKILSHKR